MEINMDKKHLLALLKISNVSLGDWGTGAAKTVDHLLKEINDGESTLIKKGNFLLRSVTGFCSNYFIARVARSVVMDFRQRIFRQLPTRAATRCRSAAARLSR